MIREHCGLIVGALDRLDRDGRKMAAKPAGALETALVKQVTAAVLPALDLAAARGLHVAHASAMQAAVNTLALAKLKALSKVWDPQMKWDKAATAPQVRAHVMALQAGRVDPCPAPEKPPAPRRRSPSKA
jgi:hypothetical protein